MKWISFKFVVWTWGEAWRAPCRRSTGADWLCATGCCAGSSEPATVQSQGSLTALPTGSAIWRVLPLSAWTAPPCSFCPWTTSAQTTERGWSTLSCSKLMSWIVCAWLLALSFHSTPFVCARFSKGCRTSTQTVASCCESDPEMKSCQGFSEIKCSFTAFWRRAYWKNRDPGCFVLA